MYKPVNWRWLNKNLAALREDEVEDLLGKEIVSECRLAIVVRLHQRLSVLRAARERRELLEQIAKVNPANDH